METIEKRGDGTVTVTKPVVVFDGKLNVLQDKIDAADKIIAALQGQIEKQEDIKEEAVALLERINAKP